MSSAGGNFPPEIISRIVEELVSNVPYASLVGKTGLATCGLTCRYWAAQVQPRLFASLGLKNAEDIQELSGFIARKPQLANFIGNISLVITTSTAPCIHHLHRLGRLISPNTSLLVTTNNDEKIPDDGVVRARPAQSLLGFPRAVPIPTLPITHLFLRDFRFTTRQGLFRLISSLPKLQSCSLKDVLFGEELPPAAVQGPVHPIPDLHSLTRFVMESSKTQTRHSTIESIHVLSAILFAAWSFPLSLQGWAYTVDAMNDLAPEGNLLVSLSSQPLWGKEGIPRYHTASSSANIYFGIQQSPLLGGSMISVVLEKCSHERLRIHLRLSRFSESDIEDLMLLDWVKFADSSRARDDVAEVVLRGSSTIMKQVAVSIIRGESLAHMAATSKLFLSPDWDQSPLPIGLGTYYRDITFNALDVHKSPDKTYADDESVIALTPEERAHWLMLSSKDAQETYLSSLQTSRSAVDARKGGGAPSSASGFVAPPDSEDSSAAANPTTEPDTRARI